MPTGGDKKNAKRRAVGQVRTVQLLLRAWDPIGAATGDTTAADIDEYDSYAPHIVSMVSAGCTLEAMTKHLSDLRMHTIGLPSERAKDRECARKILARLRPLRVIK